MTGPLTTRMATLCDDIVTQVGPQAGHQVRQISDRLTEPLRVAVAGRLKAGKSTLVNALIGRRVAPTAAGECTRVVTRFRYGPADRVVVIGHDGSRTGLPLTDDGMVPQRLGVPAARIACVDVTLTSDRLRDLTVVDTPGLASADTAVSGRAAAAVGTTTAPFDAGIDEGSAHEVATAEAVVYVFTQAVRADDAAALDAFRSASAKLASSPLNAVAVFGKADTLVGGAADPWPVAGPLADAQARLLARTVAAVVPVAALLAETAATGRLTDTDRDALRELAALPAGTLEVLLASADLFRTAPLDPDRRERLLDMLGLYGIGFTLAQLAADPGLGTGELVRRLTAASGMPRLRHTVDAAFRHRADVIKAGWALTRLDRLAGHTRDPRLRQVLRDTVEHVLQDPGYHRLRLLDAAQKVATGTVALPEAWEAELTRLATSDDPRWILGDTTDPYTAAVDAAHRWRVYAVAGAGPAQARIAHVASRGFHLLARSLR